MKEEYYIYIIDKLKGKLIKTDSSYYQNYAVDLIYKLFSINYGRTFAYQYRENTSKFIKSKYLSNYYKESIKELLKDNLNND